MHYTVEDVFALVGQFGWSQRLYFVLLASLQFFLAPHMLLNVFTGLDPSFECHYQNGTKPLVDECVNNDQQLCTLGLVYTSQYKSFASEWHLICNEKYKVALVQSIWMGGVMTGALVLGGMADVFGRLKTLMVALLGTIAFEGFSAFAPTFLTMISLRYFGGICCALVILVSFVLSQELVGSDWRSLCGMSMAMSFAVGIAIFSALASVSPDWRILTLICSLCGIVFLSLPCYVPESPRWLITQGRTAEAKKILQTIATKNGNSKALPSHWDIKSISEKGKEKKTSVLALASHPYVLLLTVIQIFSWFVNSATYYGLTMAASNLGGDVYISTALSGLIEIPACLIATPIMDRLGRRIALCGAMMLGGIACLCIQLVPSAYVTLITGLALCGKLSIAASFSVAYIHSAEIFPTIIRNSAVGVVSVAARIGGILAPLILMLGDYIPNLQFTVFGLMAVMAGMFNLKLPETLGQAMPEDISDVIAFKNIKKGKEGKEYHKLKVEDLEDGIPSPKVNPRVHSEDLEPLLEE